MAVKVDFVKTPDPPQSDVGEGSISADRAGKSAMVTMNTNHTEKASRRTSPITRV